MPNRKYEKSTGNNSLCRVGRHTAGCVVRSAAVPRAGTLLYIPGYIYVHHQRAAVYSLSQRNDDAATRIQRAVSKAKSSRFVYSEHRNVAFPGGSPVPPNTFRYSPDCVATGYLHHYNWCTTADRAAIYAEIVPG